MAKVITQEDIDKKVVRDFIDKFNQYMKNIGSMIVIDHDDFYIKASGTKIIRRGKFYDKNVLNLDVVFPSVIYDTLALAEFRKEYRFSTSTVQRYPDSVVIGQNEKSKAPNARFQVNCIEPVSQNIPFYDSIIKDLYGDKEKYSLLVHAMAENSVPFTKASGEEIDMLEEGEMVNLVTETKAGEPVNIYVTKVIFPMASKLTSLEYRAASLANSLDPKYVYVLFRETYEELGAHIYTLIATYQSI